MKKNRMEQIVFMFSDITGRTKCEAEQIIMLTETGKEIQNCNEVVLYEQQTANLWCIAKELEIMDLYKNEVSLLSISNIKKSMKNLSMIEKREGGNFYFSDIKKIKSDAKIMHKNELLKKQKKLLKIREQNKNNIRRIEKCL